MAVSTAVAVRACERVFARLCELGRDVPAGTPAAEFLAAAAREIEAARDGLETATTGPEYADVLRRLGHAGGLLDGVAQASGATPPEGLDRLSVIVDGLKVTISTSEREGRLRRRGDGAG